MNKYEGLLDDDAEELPQVEEEEDEEEERGEEEGEGEGKEGEEEANTGSQASENASAPIGLEETFGRRRRKVPTSASDVPADTSNRGVVYLSRLPTGMFEPQMKKFFSQFGEVTRLKLIRSKRTGHSRHHGYVEFAFKEVAEIVAQTMHGYLMFGHSLVCLMVPKEKMHPLLFKGWNKKFRVIPRHQIEGKRQNKEGGVYTEKQLKKAASKLDRKMKRLQSMDIDYDFKAQ